MIYNIESMSLKLSLKWDLGLGRRAEVGRWVRVIERKIEQMKQEGT